MFRLNGGKKFNMVIAHGNMRSWSLAVKYFHPQEVVRYLQTVRKSVTEE